jgi:multisubunit Na+/H+ antiporter MnhF subunit
MGFALALAATTLLSLYRVIAGPTHFDRLTGLGLIGTKTTLLLVLIGAITGRTALAIDLALTYGLVSFIGTLAIAKFFEKERLAP